MFAKPPPPLPFALLENLESGIGRRSAALRRIKVKKHLLLSDGFSATVFLRIFSNGSGREGGKKGEGETLFHSGCWLALSSVSHQSPKRMFWRTRSPECGSG